MSVQKIYLSLSKPGDIDRVINELVAYKEELKVKCRAFVERLMDIGIETAQMNTGQYAGFIVFRKEIDVTEDGCNGLLVATDGQKIVKTWYASKKDGLAQKNPRSYVISPLLMAEFGSGWLAEVLDNIQGVGQGTMPGQKHAFDDHWAWYDDHGEKHVSEGEAPTFPMHSALIAMLFEIDRIGKEIFS